MQKFPFAKTALFLGLALVLTLTGIRCTKGVPREAAEANRPVTLTWWRVFDDETAVRPIIEAYKTLHPNVTIVYRKLRFDEYERELLNALAEDRGPDILSLHNTWVRGYASKLSPLPPTLTLPFQSVEGRLKKEVVVTLKTSPTISARALKNNFVDVVASDVIIPATSSEGQVTENIYALPLALDTLVLYANRDLLNLAGIPQVPKTWGELQGAVKKLTRFDTQGGLLQSGAALGTSKNVERAADILALLMMQNGTEMLDLSGNAAFHRVPQILSGSGTLPGPEALTFYTDFANPNKEVYTWSAELPGSFEAFVAGRTALFFGYGYHLPLLKVRAPRMNLAIAQVPQIEGNPEVNFANYWVEAVSRKSPNAHWAWDFLQFAAGPDQIIQYLETTQKPTALRALINRQLEKETTSAFAAQVLTAKSWYKGRDSQAAEQALLNAIDQTLAGGEAREILNATATRVNQTLR
ncbi:extracellular solute-binding protein [Candidatus Uhrbacteria bacterium]|nr:extracellular solute-binding protein [Candidatus Uhrbacteria bacterium]